MLKIPRIPVQSVEEADRALDGLPRHPIAVVNWPEVYDYAPYAAFSAAHNGRELFLKYYAREDYSRALEGVDGRPVCNDSCVEFFASFDETGYYNFEFNAVGTAYLAFRKERPDAVRATQAVYDRIERVASFGREPFDEVEKAGEWTLTVGIPARAFYKHTFGELSGVQARANFYKCGDRLTRPHYLSWNPIPTDKPQFHAPRHFAQIEFE